MLTAIALACAGALAARMVAVMTQLQVLHLDYRDGVTILTHAYLHIWDQVGNATSIYFPALCQAERLLLKQQQLVARAHLRGERP